jgi:hypothetical protein
MGAMVGGAKRWHWLIPALLNIAHQGVTESLDFYWYRALPLSCEADSSVRIVNWLGTAPSTSPR